VKRRAISKKERLEIFNARQGKCHICGEKILAMEKWEVEHIIPFALGGKDEGDNLSVAHESCHKNKTREDVGRIAKAKRQANYHNHAKLSRTPLPCGKTSKWKRKMNGRVIRRHEDEARRNGQTKGH
jgi:5-methylcytosine-specific restriction endonuclease McrA